MKVKSIVKISISLLMLTTAINADASAALRAEGNYNAKNISLTQPLVVDGSAKINGSTFNGGEINGSSSLTDVNVLGAIKVNGSLEATNSTFLKETRINGSLKGNNSVFKNDLIISSNKTILNNCSTKNIYIKKSSSGLFSMNKENAVYLNGKSQVNGNIKFAGKGIVYVEKGVKIAGKVINGKVVKK